MSIEVRLFEEHDLNKINELLVLYEYLGYPTIAKDLLIRLKNIFNHQDYYLLLLVKDDVIIGVSGMCKMMFYEKNGEYMRVLAFVINTDH